MGARVTLKVEVSAIRDTRTGVPYSKRENTAVEIRLTTKRVWPKRRAFFYPKNFYGRGAKKDTSI
jgi:hypothetical protein